MILQDRFAGILRDERRGRAWLNSLPPLSEGKLVENAIVPIEAMLRYHQLTESCWPSVNLINADMNELAGAGKQYGLEKTLAVKFEALRQLRVAIRKQQDPQSPGDLELALATRSYSEPNHVLMVDGVKIGSVF